jgi:hypothetical protein
LNAGEAEEQGEDVKPIIAKEEEAVPAGLMPLR